MSNNQYIKAGYVQLGNDKFFLHSPEDSYFSSVPGDDPLTETLLDFSVKVTNELNAASTGVIKLYNPSEKTVDKCRPAKGGKNISFIPIKSEVGYVNFTDEILQNFISSFSIYKDGTTRILEINATDKVDSKGRIWWDKKVPGTFNGKKASEILEVILSPKKIRFGNTGAISPDPVFKTYNTNGSIADEVKALAKRVKFSYSLVSGIVYIISDKDTTGSNVAFLDAENGLIGFPEKVDKKDSTSQQEQWEGFRLKAIYAQNIQLRQEVSFIDGFGQRQTGRCRGYEKYFSTFEESFSSYMVET